MVNKSLKQDSNKREAELEKQLGNLSGKYSEMGNLLETGLKKLSGLTELYENGSISKKRKIVSSIFPENLVFDGMGYRTPRINEVIRLIYQKTSNLTHKKNRTNLLDIDLSHFVIPLGFERHRPPGQDPYIKSAVLKTKKRPFEALL